MIDTSPTMPSLSDLDDEGLHIGAAHFELTCWYTNTYSKLIQVNCILHFSAALPLFKFLFGDLCTTVANGRILEREALLLLHASYLAPLIEFSFISVNEDFIYTDFANVFTDLPISSWDELLQTSRTTNLPPW